MWTCEQDVAAYRAVQSVYSTPHIKVLLPIKMRNCRTNDYSYYTPQENCKVDFWQLCVVQRRRNLGGSGIVQGFKEELSWLNPH